MALMVRWITLTICLSMVFTFCISFNNRLPTSLVPKRYNIEIITYLNDPTASEQFYFTGTVKIKMLCLSSTSKITLHSKALEIFNVSVTNLNYEHTKVKKIEFNTENDFLIISLEQYLLEDTIYDLEIKFKGNLTTGMNGYYRSSYSAGSNVTGNENDQRWLAVTQFEPVYARKAFPCFDEPSFKASFVVSLGHRSEYTSLSNMPLDKTGYMSGKNDWVLDTYQESVPMSTYLVAFAIHDFKHITSFTEFDAVTFKIWARPNAIDQVHFASKLGPKVLNFYEDFFHVKYPLPKQDMIAIPDFSSGAMENWGLITYRETALLVKTNISTVQNMARVAKVISHELAHQWFGNLVTMKWWSDLWLNEGFATYMASLAVQHVFPKWNMLRKDTISNLLLVYHLDSLQSSHQISLPGNYTGQITELFDTISYKKGAFLLRMMNNYLGYNVFQKGVSSYLQKYAFGNAEQDDLWNALTIQAQQNKSLPLHLTVKIIMDSWTLQSGYPLINVKRNYETGVMEITQEKYFTDTDLKHLTSNYCWWVPITYSIEDSDDIYVTTPKIWLSCPKKKVVINIPDRNKWVIFNLEATGLYKVNYDEHNWKLLSNYLQFDEHINIPEMNRVLLIENSMSLASTGKLSYEIAFSIISYLKNEMEYLPWRTALSQLDTLSNLLKRTANYGLIKNLVRKLVAHKYKKVGGLKIPKSKQSDVDAVYLQTLITKAACNYGLKECREEAVRLFQQWKNNSNYNPIDKELRSLVYCVAIEEGNEEEWDFLWEKYKESNVGNEKLAILSALGCTTDIRIIKRYMTRAMDKNSDIRTQDLYNVFSSLGESGVGFLAVKSFLTDQFEDLYNKYGKDVQRLPKYIKITANKLITEWEQKEFEEMLMANEKYFEKENLQIKQARETVKINVQWHQNNYKKLEKILMESNPISVTECSCID